MTLKPTLKSHIRFVDHVAFTVPDLEEAVAFCTDVLGAQELYRFAREDDPRLMVEDIGVHPEAALRAAMLRLTDQICVELFQWRAPGQNQAMPQPSDIGGHHLCLVVDDLDAAVAELRRHPDVRVYGSGGKLMMGPRAGGRWIYFRTKWGLQIELVEDPPPRQPEEGSGRRMASHESQALPRERISRPYPSPEVPAGRKHAPLWVQLLGSA